jgi:hypothetical protein
MLKTGDERTLPFKASHHSLRSGLKRLRPLSLSFQASFITGNACSVGVLLDVIPDPRITA